ncbi:hypothetical protein PMW_204 [Pseudomonas phage phiPMW]|uniref:Uncharacterized protein n=1 Tax=Pseudomonas phage phiPMW TaxID=1815582 RepID=A0A1S5R1Q7_9CAUD|nr:hypothetical protein FDG97_gp146 [Pseudomonas phage phiPMW]ANA49329.1 hypothetical protein PMW_204 [Pseudomonas phage phiPMW]
MTILHDLVSKPLLTVGDMIDRLTNHEYGDLTDVILAIDLSQQDSDFTIATIKKLFESLCGDLSKDEMKELMKELKQINKEKHK